MGDKVKIEKKQIKPKKGGKNHVPGAGTYNVESAWGWDNQGKT